MNYLKSMSFLTVIHTVTLFILTLTVEVKAQNCESAFLPQKLSLANQHVEVRTFALDYDDQDGTRAPTYDIVVGGSIQSADRTSSQPFLSFHKLIDDYSVLWDRRIVMTNTDTTERETEVAFIDFSDDLEYIGVFLNGAVTAGTSHFAIISMASALTTSPTIQLWQLRTEQSEAYDSIASINFASFVAIDYLFLSLHSANFDPVPRIDFMRVSMVAQGSVSWHKRTQPASGQDIPFYGNGVITAVGGGSPPTYAYSAGWSYNPNDPLAERSIWVFEFPANGDPAERSLEFFWVPERWSGDINQYPENACFVPTHMEWANDAIFLGSEIQYYVADGLTAGADTTPVLLIEIEQSNDPTVWQIRNKALIEVKYVYRMRLVGMTVVSAVEHTIAIFAQPDAPNEVGLYGVINLDTAEVTNYRVAAVDTTGQFTYYQAILYPSAADATLLELMVVGTSLSLSCETLEYDYNFAFISGSAAAVDCPCLQDYDGSLYFGQVTQEAITRLDNSGDVYGQYSTDFSDFPFKNYGGNLGQTTASYPTADLIQIVGACTNPDLGTVAWVCECAGLETYPISTIVHVMESSQTIVSTESHDPFTFARADCTDTPALVYSLVCYTDSTYETETACPSQVSYNSFTLTVTTTGIEAAVTDIVVHYRIYGEQYDSPAYGSFIESTFSIQDAPPPPAPIITNPNPALTTTTIIERADVVVDFEALTYTYNNGDTSLSFVYVARVKTNPSNPLPSWLEFDSDTLTFYVTEASPAGTYEFAVVAYLSHQAGTVTSSHLWTLVVEPIPPPQFILPSGDVIDTEDASQEDVVFLEIDAVQGVNTLEYFQNYDYDYMYEDNFNIRYEASRAYSVTTSLPSFIVVDPVFLSISVRFNSIPGTYYIRITACADDPDDTCTDKGIIKVTIHESEAGVTPTNSVVNTAPYFEDDLEDVYVNVGTVVFVTLPERIDDQGDDIEGYYTSEMCRPVFTYHGDDNVVELAPTSEEQVGTCIALITLCDCDSASDPKHRSYIFTYHIVPADVVIPKTPNVKPEESDDEDVILSLIQASIVDVTRTGLVYIQFNKDLYPVNILDIDENVLYCWLQSEDGNIGVGTYLYESDSSVDSHAGTKRQLQIAGAEWIEQQKNDTLSFRWVAVEWQAPNTLVLELDFDRPGHISVDQIDKVNVMFLDNYFFTEQNYYESYIITNYTVSKAAPTQLRAGRSSIIITLLPWVVVLCQWTVAICFVLNAFFVIPQHYLWTLFNTFQIYVHFVLIRIHDMPANVYVFLHAFLESAKLKVLPSHYLMERFFELYKDETMTDEYLLDAKYDSGHIMRLAAHIYVDIALLIAATLIAWVIFSWLCAPLGFVKGRIAQRRVLTYFAQGILLFIMLATFELFLSSMLTFSYWNAPSSTAYSKFLAFAALILPAATAAYALYVNFAFKDQCANTQDNVFRWKLGIFYYHYKHKTNQVAASFYWPVFIFRRFLVALIIIFMTNNPWGQLASIIALSTLMIMYLGYVQPWIEKKYNTIDIADECFLLGICYCMIHLTPYGYVNDNRYVWGIVLIVLVLIHILYHLSLLVFNTVAEVHLRVASLLPRKQTVSPVVAPFNLKSVDVDAGLQSRKTLRAKGESCKSLGSEKFRESVSAYSSPENIKRSLTKRLTMSNQQYEDLANKKLVSSERPERRTIVRRVTRLITADGKPFEGEFDAERMVARPVSGSSVSHLAPRARVSNVLSESRESRLSEAFATREEQQQPVTDVSHLNQDATQTQDATQHQVRQYPDTRSSGLERPASSETETVDRPVETFHLPPSTKEALTSLQYSKQHSMSRFEEALSLIEQIQEQRQDLDQADAHQQEEALAQALYNGMLNAYKADENVGPRNDNQGADAHAKLTDDKVLRANAAYDDPGRDLMPAFTNWDDEVDLRMYKNGDADLDESGEFNAFNDSAREGLVDTLRKLKTQQCDGGLVDEDTPRAKRKKKVRTPTPPREPTPPKAEPITAKNLLYKALETDFYRKNPYAWHALKHKRAKNSELYKESQLQIDFEQKLGVDVFLQGQEGLEDSPPARRMTLARQLAKEILSGGVDVSRKITLQPQESPFRQRGTLRQSTANEKSTAKKQFVKPEDSAQLISAAQDEAEQIGHRYDGGAVQRRGTASSSSQRRQ